MPLRMFLLNYKFLILIINIQYGGTLRLSWLRHYVKSWEIAGSIPDVIGFFN
jgi:hypothetical protein